MSKTCPNCGVNSPNNAKFCIECGYSLDGVEINSEDKVSDNKSDSTGSPIKCIIMIAVVFILIIFAASSLFTSGDDTDTNNITVTFSEVTAWDSTYSGATHYSYYVNGYIDNFPDDTKGYMIKTIYYDKNNNNLVSTTEKLSYFENDKDADYDVIISAYSTENYLDVDHVTVQVIKDGNVLNEYSEVMNMNKITVKPNNSTN